MLESRTNSWELGFERLRRAAENPNSTRSGTKGVRPRRPTLSRKRNTLKRMWLLGVGKTLGLTESITSKETLERKREKMDVGNPD